MNTITTLIERADSLSRQTMSDSITPNDVGGLIKDLLLYISDLEQNLKNIGIRKTYLTYAEMEEDVSPVDFKGNPIRFGQLVAINSSDEDAGKVYAYCNPGWMYVVRLTEIVQYANDVSELKDAQRDLFETFGQISAYYGDENRPFDLDGLTEFGVCRLYGTFAGFSNLPDINGNLIGAMINVVNCGYFKDGVTGSFRQNIQQVLTIVSDGSSGVFCRNGYMESTLGGTFRTFWYDWETK